MHKYLIEVGHYKSELLNYQDLLKRSEHYVKFGVDHKITRYRYKDYIPYIDKIYELNFAYGYKNNNKHRYDNIYVINMCQNLIKKIVKEDLIKEL